MSEPPSSRPAASADRPLDGTRNANPADDATHGRDPLSQGFWALFWHQFSNWPMSVQPRFLRLPLTLLYRIMTKLGAWMAGIFLPYMGDRRPPCADQAFRGVILVENRIGTT